MGQIYNDIRSIKNKGNFTMEDALEAVTMLEDHVSARNCWKITRVALPLRDLIDVMLYVAPYHKLTPELAEIKKSNFYDMHKIYDIVSEIEEDESLSTLWDNLINMEVDRDDQHEGALNILNYLLYVASERNI